MFRAMIHLLRSARLGGLRLFYGEPDSWLPAAEEPYGESPLVQVACRISRRPLDEALL